MLSASVRAVSSGDQSKFDRTLKRFGSIPLGIDVPYSKGLLLGIVRRCVERRMPLRYQSEIGKIPAECLAALHKEAFPWRTPQRVVV